MTTTVRTAAVNFLIISLRLACKMCTHYPGIKLVLTVERLGEKSCRRRVLVFIVLSTATQAISRRGKNKSDCEICKNGESTCKACKRTVFHCQLCKLVTFFVVLVTQARYYLLFQESDVRHKWNLFSSVLANRLRLPYFIMQVESPP